MVTAPSSTVSGLRRAIVSAALMGLAACTEAESEEAKEVASEVAQVTQETIERGVESAKEQLDKVDTKKLEKTWDGMVEAVEDSTRRDPATPAVDPLADAKQAIACDEPRERCTVTADFAGRAREHSTRVASQVRVSPARGSVRGVRIDAIDAGTIADLVGLKVGDVVTHVNGTALGSTQDAVMLYMSVRSAKRFVIDYQRAGKTRSLRVDVV